MHCVLVTSLLQQDWSRGATDIESPEALPQGRYSRAMLYSASKGIRMHDTGSGSGRSCWRKSSYSHTNGECVEVTSSSAGIKVRDSTKKDSAVIFYSAANWQTFVGRLKNP
jgi:hypothetical protein